MEHKIKPILPAFLIVVIVIAGVVWGVLRYQSTRQPKFSTDNVTYASLDVSTQEGIAKLLSDFPANVSIETEGVTQAETLFYPEKQITVTNVVYTSSKQQEELSTIYEKYLTESGFTLNVKEKSLSRSMYRATKDNTELTVIITPGSGQMNVFLSYLIRE